MLTLFVITKNKINEIKELINLNHHTDARILGAKCLGDELLAENYEMVKFFTPSSGINQAMYVKRRELDKDLFAKAKKILKPDDYKLFYGVF